MSNHPTTIVIGAGPAGLTTAYTLAKAGSPVIVLEADGQYVGGIARTVEYKGFRFDIGGHRFFSKSAEIDSLWTELLPGDMLMRPRLSRIYYNGQFFAYPLKPFEALRKLGVLESAHCIGSYAAAKVKPTRKPKSFEDWVVNQFGWRLYQIFFKTYTEKVWGMSCRDISADWAAQRIKGLSLFSVALNAMMAAVRPSGGRRSVKSLIESFRYPRLGPGMLWEHTRDRIRALGGQVLMGAEVTSCSYDSARAQWTVAYRSPSGENSMVCGHHLVSTAAIHDLVPSLSPRVSAACLDAAASLKYRDFLTVVALAKGEPAVPDNWIYIHEPTLRVGRVQNFKSWSPDLVPGPGLSSFGLEYFCSEGEPLWEMADRDLLALGASEIASIGLARAEDVFDGCVIRQRRAYPVYDADYLTRTAAIREELERVFPTLHMAGRNGMHRYNNQDHSMMTGILCARNIIAGERRYDPWRVNEDAEYHEEESTRSKG